MLTSGQFFQLTFVEQMNFLYQVQDENPSGGLSFLKELYVQASDHQALRSLIRDALQTILEKNDSEFISTLKSGSNEFRQICFQTLSVRQLKSSLPVLHQMVEEETDEKALFEILSCIASIMDASSLPIFYIQLHSKNAIIASLAIETIGRFKDATILGVLFEIIEQGEKRDDVSECDIKTAKALEAIGKIGGSEAVSFLLFKIHHRSPAVRCQIMRVLEEMGPDCVLPFIKSVFQTGDDDMKGMAADLLGRFKDKRGPEIMSEALVSGQAKAPKVRLTIYQALGAAPFLKSLVTLMDGLAESDPQILHSVILSLDRNIMGGMMNSFLEKLLENEQKQDLILKAIISVKAFRLFTTAFANQTLREKLIQTLQNSKDIETVNAFIECIESLKTEEGNAALAKLPAKAKILEKMDVLAVDDSKVILRFFRTVCAELGIGLVTAENGREGLEILQKFPTIRLIFADMNMPVMDGVEFTKKVRSHAFLNKIPIVMVTTESESSQVEVAMKAGVSDFITKPFTEEEISQRIRELWKQRERLGTPRTALVAPPRNAVLAT